MRVFTLIRAMRTNNELSLRHAHDILLENKIRIVEVGDDEREPTEICSHFSFQFSSARKERSKWSRLNRTHRIDNLALDRKLGDVRIAQHFDVGVRKLFAQSPQRGKRQDKIANRAAS